jgi:hypothetical protein
MNGWLLKAALLALGLVIGFGFMACGDDDDDSSGAGMGDDDASPAEDDDSSSDDDNDASPADDDDNDATPTDDDDDDALDCEAVVEQLVVCGAAIFDGEDPFSAEEALADCRTNGVYDRPTWDCLAACADLLEDDCANALDEIVCVPLCIYYGGSVPDDCTPLYPDAEVCGHRGACMYAPANTIPAYEARSPRVRTTWKWTCRARSTATWSACTTATCPPPPTARERWRT